MIWGLICWDFQQGQGRPCNSMHQPLPSPWLHTTLPQLCTTFLLMPRCLLGHFDSMLRSHNTIWFSDRNRLREGDSGQQFLQFSLRRFACCTELISVTSGSIYDTSPSRVADWCHKFQSPLPLRNVNNENSSTSSNNLYCWLDRCLSDYSELLADFKVLKNSCHREIHLQTNMQYAFKCDLL